MELSHQIIHVVKANQACPSTNFHSVDYHVAKTFTYQTPRSSTWRIFTRSVRVGTDLVLYFKILLSLRHQLKQSRQKYLFAKTFGKVPIREEVSEVVTATSTFCMQKTDTYSSSFFQATELILPQNN